MRSPGTKSPFLVTLYLWSFDMAKKRISYRDKAVAEMRANNRDEDYIEDWRRIYDETGLDMRDMRDGMDVDAFLEAYENDDLDAMIILS